MYSLKGFETILALNNLPVQAIVLAVAARTHLPLTVCAVIPGARR
jgi:hypothetical protein